jgi:hypothetical protein
MADHKNGDGVADQRNDYDAVRVREEELARGVVAEFRRGVMESLPRADGSKVLQIDAVIQHLEENPNEVQRATSVWMAEAGSHFQASPATQELDREQFIRLTYSIIGYGDLIGASVSPLWHLGRLILRSGGSNGQNLAMTEFAARLFDACECAINRLKIAAHVRARKAGQPLPELSVSFGQELLPALSPAEREIVDVIRDVGHRMTTREILEMLEAKGPVSVGTTKQALAAMRRHRVLTNRSDTRPRGYGLPEWA